MDMLFDLLRILVVNLVLSGDNAIVIAMCSRALPKHQQTKAILWGSGGAICLRFALTLLAVYLLEMPYLQFTGGIMLLWIGVKLLKAEDEPNEANADENFWNAVRTIVIADLVMSLDNTLAIAAIAKGDTLMLAVGLAISIPIIIFGSRVLMSVMNRYPILVYGGAAMIAWSAGDMIVHDQKIGVLLVNYIPGMLIRIAAVVIVLGAGYFYFRAREQVVTDRED